MIPFRLIPLHNPKTKGRATMTWTVWFQEVMETPWRRFKQGLDETSAYAVVADLRSKGFPARACGEVQFR